MTTLHSVQLRTLTGFHFTYLQNGPLDSYVVCKIVTLRELSLSYEEIKEKLGLTSRIFGDFKAIRSTFEYTGFGVPARQRPSTQK